MLELVIEIVLKKELLVRISLCLDSFLVFLEIENLYELPLAFLDSRLRELHEVL